MRIVFGKGAFQGPISGADEILTANAIQLQQAGHDVSVLLLYPHALSDQYYLRLQEAGVKISSIASTGVHSSLNAGRRLARRFVEVFPTSQSVIRRRAQKIATRVALSYYDQCRVYFKQSSADLVHVITPDPSAMVIIRAAHDARIPVLYQEVGMPYHPPGFEPYYEQFTSVLPLCAEVTALSPQLARECREKLPAPKVSVLPILIDDELDRASSVTERHAKGGVTFGFAARLEHLKGALVLIDAFAETQRKFTNIKLQIAGSGSLKQKMMARIKAHGISE
ncbi:MAG TPA: glycosyltransferase, partial [Pyrinomonadaceae bacterium]|nr:glycosyltransferase [Pyrinomonadaceae bacterium]